MGVSLGVGVGVGVAVGVAVGFGFDIWTYKYKIKKKTKHNDVIWKYYLIFFFDFKKKQNECKVLSLLSRDVEGIDIPPRSNLPISDIV